MDKEEEKQTTKSKKTERKLVIPGETIVSGDDHLPGDFTRKEGKDIIKIYKDNFWNIGEFALNTNPKAKLCDYLIVNEKIAGMIHVALGLGFEPDRKTMYHWDIVVNAPKQKLDIYGVDKNKKIHRVLKNGEFVV